MKEKIVTFKADAALAEALDAIPNKSAFIRTAISTAFDHSCPLCLGTGILTPEQKRHWDTFRRDHIVEECSDCHARYLTCEVEGNSVLKKRRSVK